MAQYIPTNWANGDTITAEGLNKIEAELQRLSGLIGTTDDNIPAGLIAVWSGTINDVPTGWVICDGENGTPDLRDKFVLGAGENHEVDEVGGSEEVTLTVAQMPRHNHSIQTVVDTSDTYSRTYKMDGGLGTNSDTNYTGGSQPHPNMPPYYTLLYIMKI